MEWFSIIIPIIFIILLLVMFIREVQWWEPLLFIPCIFVVMIFRSCSESSLVKDYEYWNGYITEVWYYEEWSEWIVDTCSEEYECGEDSEGNTIYCTRYYDCSYEKIHPEYYKVINNIGQSWYISKHEYSNLVKQFGNKTFVNMNRRYCCGNNGNAYVTLYKGEPDKIEHTTTKHIYENRVKASNSVFKFTDISRKEADSLKLFDYPEIKDRYQRHLLGLSSQRIEKKLQYLNGTLGHEKQLNVYILIFHDKPYNYMNLQSSYWRGGNKNEFNIVISHDKNGNIKWGDVMTWSESFELKLKVRDYIMSHSGEKMNYDEFLDFLYTEMNNNFKRKSFSDFSYLRIEMTKLQFTWLYIVMITICLGISAYILFNEFNNE